VSLRSKNDCGKSKVTGWNYSIRKEIMIEAKRRKPMNATNITYIAVFTLITMLIAIPTLVLSAEKPKYSADVPQGLLTPDKVQHHSF
jgi:hypothetical protein